MAKFSLHYSAASREKARQSLQAGLNVFCYNSINMPLKCVIFTQSDSAAAVFTLASRLAAGGAGQVAAVILEVPEAGFALRAARHIKKYGALSLAYKTAGLAARKIFSAAARLNFATLRLAAKETPQGLADRCALEKIPFLRTADFSSEGSISFLSGLGADLGIVYGTGILKKDFFSVPRLGSINIHKRRLPDYRGGGAVGLWELLAGEKEIGITVHKVSDRLDKGEIVAETAVPIDEGDTLVSLKLKADLAGDELIAAAVGSLAAGAPCRPRAAGEGRLYRDPSPARFSYYKALLCFRRLRRRRPDLKEILKRVLKLAYLYGSFTPLRALFARLRGRAPVIIFYGHLVSDRNHYMAIGTEAFGRYLSYLSRHYSVIPLDEAVRRVRSGRNYEPAVVLTFDDGYAENMANLRAGLYRTGRKAAFFISSGYIGSGGDFPHDAAKGVAGFPALSWEQVALLKSEGHEICSHTQSHVRCSRPEEFAEIGRSRLEIEARLKSPVRYFSFPWGKKKDILPAAFEEVRASGYEAAFLADSGDAMNYGHDIFGIERTPLPVSGSLIDLEAVIYGWNEVAKLKEKILKYFSRSAD